MAESFVPCSPYIFATNGTSYLQKVPFVNLLAIACCILQVNGCPFYFHTCFSASHVSITMRVVSSPSTLSVLSYMSSEEENTQTYDKLNIHISKHNLQNITIVMISRCSKRSTFSHKPHYFWSTIAMFQTDDITHKTPRHSNKKRFLFIPDFLDMCCYLPS